MKSDIHPNYGDSSVTCSCGNTFTTKSTKATVVVELCNECHPSSPVSRSLSTLVVVLSDSRSATARRLQRLALQRHNAFGRDTRTCAR